MSETRRLRFLVGTSPEREWLTMAQLVDRGYFPTSEAARKFITRRPDLPHGRKGTRLVIDRAVLDRYFAEAGRKVSA